MLHGITSKRKNNADFFKFFTIFVAGIVRRKINEALVYRRRKILNIAKQYIDEVSTAVLKNIVQNAVSTFTKEDAVLLD